MRKKIKVGVLGATGSVGQKFLILLENHPWFEVTSLCASDKKAGLPYHEAVNWFQNEPCPEKYKNMRMEACHPELNAELVFSGMDASVAGRIETEMAKAGKMVISNSRNHRMDEDVPLLIPEVNPDHLSLINRQGTKGKILTNPNCSTIGLAMALKPLWDRFGIEAVQVTTLQALSGAGYPGVSSLDILDNVIPHISGEEHKMETEPLKIFGTHGSSGIEMAGFSISAHCNRVAVVNGHLERVSVALRKSVKKEDLIHAFQSFVPEIKDLDLPSAPSPCLHFFSEPGFPQPKRHVTLGDGMVVSIGQLGVCGVMDFKFSLLVHNTVRGAAGGAILNAEMLVARGYLND